MLLSFHRLNLPSLCPRFTVLAMLTPNIQSDGQVDTDTWKLTLTFTRQIHLLDLTWTQAQANLRFLRTRTPVGRLK